MANIGRIDINTEISRFKYQFSMPREVHSDDLLQVYAYLNQKYNSIFESDFTYPGINKDDFMEF